MSNLLPISQKGFDANPNREQVTSLTEEQRTPNQTKLRHRISKTKRPHPVEEAEEPEQEEAALVRESDSSRDERNKIDDTPPSSANVPSVDNPDLSNTQKRTGSPPSQSILSHRESASNATTSTTRPESDTTKPQADNLLFRIARVLVVVVAFMLVLYISYWIAKNVYGVDMLGWTRHLLSNGSAHGEENLQMSPEASGDLDLASTVTVPETTASAPNPVDVDNSPASSMFRNIGTLFGATSAASAASAAAPDPTLTTTIGTPPLHQQGTIPSHPDTNRLTVTQGDHLQSTGTHTSYPLDTRRADTLLDLLARIE